MRINSSPSDTTTEELDCSPRELAANCSNLVSGFEVVLAVDGKDAVDKFKLRPHDFRFVLLDLTMPRMNGVEAFGAMKLIRAETPVVLMSGYNEQAAVERFAGRGLAGFIQKPFQMKSLLERVRILLEPAEAA